MTYPFREIEKKWQQYWAKNKTFKTNNPTFTSENGEEDEVKPKYYVLDMFPYPSGAGLHVGHPLGYIASDIVARYKRLKGFNVLHPMGYDSFGLPAEQYAIQTGQHPAITTEDNIKRYREQLDKIGLSFDWDREIRTSEPNYYKWTQWIFLKLFNSWYNPETDRAEPIEKLIQKFQNEKIKLGTSGKVFYELSEKEKSDVLMEYRLAYLSEAWVNWCPQLGTVLANEEVKDGVSERGGYPVERKLMPQWSLRITAYAERLLKDLDKIEWSESIKESQRNWIGKSEGCSLKFRVTGFSSNFLSFSSEIPKFVHELYEKYGTLPQRLSPQEELGRIEGGSFHVEATLVAEKSPISDASANYTQKQAERLIQLAKERGCFIENTREKFGVPHAPETVESDVYYVEDGTITKVNNGIYYDSPLDFLDSYAVWNFLFPETKYTLTGIALNENKVAFILKQPFIKAKRSATLEEISNELEKLGFEKNGSRHKGFYHPKLDIWLRDLNEGNVFIDEFDKVRFIDAYIDIKERSKKRNIQGASSILKKETGSTFSMEIEVFTTRPDTIFGVTFLTIAPESDLVRLLTIPEQKQKVEAYIQYAKNRSERDRQSEVKKITGEFTGSYCIHPFTGEKIPIWVGEYVLAGYGTGVVMGVPAHDSRDHAFAKHFGLPIKQVITTPEGWDIQEKSWDEKEGKAINSDFINGMEVKDAIKKVISEVEKCGIGKRKVQYRLRDAVFGRQRYWGEPIPIYYENGIPKPVDESDLPIVLPEVDKYLPTETGEPPLARAKNWKYKGKYEYEKTTMPGWAGSSWYYLRYMDAKNDKEFVSKNAVNYWQNVDLYIGGSEHATGHLLYVRFWTKFLYDLGYIPFDEPAKKLINQGMIQGISMLVKSRVESEMRTADGSILTHRKHRISSWSNNSSLMEIRYPIDFVKFENGKYFLDEFSAEKTRNKYPAYRDYYLEDGVDKIELQPVVEKMSKSKWNVVTPDEICNRFGSDCLRMYEMFLGPLEMSKPWNTNGISGVFNFLNRFWRLFHKENVAKNPEERINTTDIWEISNQEPTKQELKILHKTIKKIQQDIENYSFNTAVSQFMICTNKLTELKCNKRKILEPLVILLSPFAPHIAEELWEKLGYNYSIAFASFPAYNELLATDDTFAYPVSFNGKMRFNLELSLELTPAEIEKEVLSFEQTKKYLGGKQPKKVIVVPKRIVNIVV